VVNGSPPPADDNGASIAAQLLDRPTFDSEIFALNPNPTIHERRVGRGRHRVLIVDNFYQFPERVLGLVDELEFFDDPKITLSFPGRRAIAPANLSHLIPVIMRYTRKTEPALRDNMLLSVQGLWGNTPLTPRQLVPHNDPTATALLYLNRPEDCSGGTGLYRHAATGLELVPLSPDEQMFELARELGYPVTQLRTRDGYVAMTERVIFNTRFANRDGSMLNQGNEYWELMELIEMRCNRLVVYDGRIPHTVYFEPGTFEEVPRFVQMLSLKLDGEGW
jgi:Family of unknown function (DUF6445)